MFESLSVLLFNTTEIERNLFGMADDVYRSIDIFEKAGKFEARIARPYEMVSKIIDCIVFMAVALTIVGLTLQKRFVKLWKLSRLSHLREQMSHRVSEKVIIAVARSASATSLPENVEEQEDDGISNPKTLVDDTEDALEKKSMVGTAQWAKNWLYSTKIKSFGSIYDNLFR